MKEKKPTFKLWEVIMIAFISSLIMSLSTGYVVYRDNKSADCSSLSDDSYVNEFLSSYNSILSNYYDDVDENGLVEAAISGMLDYLGDPYTTYLNETSTTMLTDSLTGTYEGIGVEVTENDDSKIEIADIFDDSPASKAGLKVGDIITSINGTDLTDKTTTEAVALIQDADDITIVVTRDGESLTFSSLEKATLYVPAISSTTYESNGKTVGYIYVSKFSDTIYEQFSDALSALESKGIDSLIIDLRDNTGGYLVGAENIAQIFLEKGKLIYSLKSKLETTDYKDTTAESKNYKVYILMNGNTASASEVLSAALKYSYGATLVGVTSYGKGKVQQTSTLTDGSMIKYTSAEWLTPKGDCIDGVGLTPDITVELSDDYTNNPSVENDNQLQTAISEISK